MLVSHGPAGDEGDEAKAGPGSEAAGMKTQQSLADSTLCWRLVRGCHGLRLP